MSGLDNALAPVLGFRRIVKAARTEDLFQNRSQVAVSVRYQVVQRGRRRRTQNRIR